MSDLANLSSLDHRQGCSNERPQDHGIKSLMDARLFYPSVTNYASNRSIARNYAQHRTPLLPTTSTTNEDVSIEDPLAERPGP